MYSRPGKCTCSPPPLLQPSCYAYILTYLVQHSDVRATGCVWAKVTGVTVTRGGGGPPRVTPSRGDTRLKLISCVAENLKRTLDKRREDGSGEETTAKKGRHFPEAMTKKGRQFISRKNRVTPSVAAPGDTNPSDATGKSLTKISY